MTEEKSIWVGGKQTVISILELSKQDVLECYSTHDLSYVSKLFKITSKKKINELFKNKNFNHQGVAAKIKIKKKLSLTDFILKKNSNAIILDDVTDIGNIGAIIRSCVAFGIKDIILEKEILQGNLENIYKTSSGMSHQINLITVTNLNNALNELKKNNYWITGMDSSGNNQLGENKWFDKNIIIFGSEGKGIRNLIKQNCDQLVKIKIKNESKSINVSNACAITLYDLCNKIKEDF